MKQIILLILIAGILPVIATNLEGSLTNLSAVLGSDPPKLEFSLCY